MPLPFSAPLRRLPLVVAIALAAVPAAAFADPLTQGRAGDTARVLPAAAGRAQPYLVRLEAPSLAAAVREGRLPGIDAGKRLDLHAAAAIDYLDGLRVAQQAFLQQASVALGRSLASVGAQFEFRHAYNGVVVRVTAAEAKRLATLPGVAAVLPPRRVPVATDRGPQLIGAPNIWNGTLDGVADRVFGDGFDGPAGNRGEGIVAGIVDTGLNFAHPSFAAKSGDYQHVNPLGAGHYLGLCGPLPSPDWTPQCNDKVIGAYDFVSEFMPDILADDPAATNGPGPVDENGHGSHTASTVAGNRVIAQVPGGPTLPISGVAPHANLIVYNACYTTGDGRGNCLYPSLVAAVDQAVADGIVDVLNYSIAGGNEPWTEEPSQAFLDAVDADIFVAASAGNSGPSAGSSGHAEPWVTTIAASTHGRGAFVNMLRVTGPAPVPPELGALPMTIPTSAVPLSAPIAGALAYNAADPLQCAPAPAGSYADRVVLIRRGTCTFAAKVLNAQAGGAAAVVLYNNAAGDINPGVDGSTIPVAVLTQVQGEAVAAFYATGNSAEVRLDYPSEATVEQPDQIARFSSRGPVSLPLLKPDIAAPGSNILAAFAGDANSFGVLSGTSMASPHIAGAAALIRKAHPEWTPAEVKSALMLTSKNEGIVAQPNGTPATAFEMGAGRVRADVAIRSELLMNETSYRYLRADPARGGDPASLNVPSLGSDSCVGNCSFVRSFRNVGQATRSWAVSIAGIAGTATPSTLTLAPGASGDVEFALDVGGRDQGGYVQGEVTLTPDSGQTLHLPAAVFVDPFKLELTPARFDVEVAAGGSASASFNVRNLGNAGLDWNLLAGVNSVPVVNQVADTRDGLVSSLYSDANSGAFVGDDIVLDQPTAFRKLSVPGFLFANFGDTVDMYASSITWSIYADAGGKPSGHPGDGTTPLWTLNLPVDAPGVDLSLNALDVDLATAGAALDLAAGKYWLVAYPVFDSHTVNGVGVMWFRFLMGVQANGMGQAFNNDPEFGGDPGSAAWEGISTSWDGHFDAAMIGTADRQCTPSWATPAATSGAVGAGATQTVDLAIDASGLAPGEHLGQLCVASNDPAKPMTLIPIRLNVTP